MPDENSERITIENGMFFVNAVSFSGVTGFRILKLTVYVTGRRSVVLRSWKRGKMVFSFWFLVTNVPVVNHVTPYL